MSSDWLKIEINTPEKPEIWAIAHALDIDPDAVVGKLIRIWAWFDQQTETGNAPSVTKSLLDRHVGVSGFCNAVIQAGWMTDDGESIALPNFARHNGKTAKKRALTARRVAKHKAQGNADSNAPLTPDALPSKSKEKDKSPSSRKLTFDDDDMKIAAAICDGIRRIVPTLKEPNLDAWANTVRLMRERDGRTHEQVLHVFEFANCDSFWQSNILSPDKLREKFDQLTAKMEPTGASLLDDYSRGVI